MMASLFKISMISRSAMYTSRFYFVEAAIHSIIIVTIGRKTVRYLEELRDFSSRVRKIFHPEGLAVTAIISAE